ncbi:family 16 glycosylhydrolase [Actibacterium mucosum]|nr:family 16 glycosylhydrolase [Actibacterium mucosum]
MSSQASCPAFEDRFQTGASDRWHVANYAFDHPHFDTDWSKENVTFGNGVELRLNPREGVGNRFHGGSIRTQSRSGFGSFEVEAKPAAGPGVVSGFFAYSGPYYGTAHNEIDIEFLGNDPTRLHVATHCNGKETSELVPLGFDASKAFHRYRFDWRANKVQWYVDGRPVVRFEGEQNVPKPPVYIFANLWAASPEISAWAGRTHARTRCTTRIKRLKYMPHQI